VFLSFAALNDLLMLFID